MDLSKQERVKQHFEEMFQKRQKPWKHHTIEPLFYTFLDLQPPDAKYRVLDIGCGDGWAASIAAQKGWIAYGIDSSPTAIHEAIKESSKQNLKINFEIGDALSLPYKNNFFDAIIDGGLFHHILPENRDIYLKNILRVLKAEGLFYLSVFSKNSPTKIGYHFTRNEIENFFGNAFTVLHYQEDELSKDTSFLSLHFILQRMK